MSNTWIGTVASFVFCLVIYLFLTPHTVTSLLRIIALRGPRATAAWHEQAHSDVLSAPPAAIETLDNDNGPILLQKTVFSSMPSVSQAAAQPAMLAASAALAGSAVSALLASALSQAGAPSAIELRGTAWRAWSWPLSPSTGSEAPACSAAAPAGGGSTYPEFQTRLRYASHDRMGERALLEPALRLVHLVAPAPGAGELGPLAWPHLSPHDLAAVCSDAVLLRCLRPEFLPPGGCAGSAAAAAAESAPTEGPHGLACAHLHC